MHQEGGKPRLLGFEYKELRSPLGSVCFAHVGIIYTPVFASTDRCCAKSSHIAICPRSDAPHMWRLSFLPTRKQMKKSSARFIRSSGRRSAREGGSSPGCRPSRRWQCRDPYRKLRGSAPQPVHACGGFFFGVSVTLACVAGTLQPVEDSCYFEGRRYSPGALALMGRVEMACTVKNGSASWARPSY